MMDRFSCPRIFAALLLPLMLLTACGPRFMPPAALQVTPVMTDASLISFDGMRLPLRQWLPAEKPSAVVIALHGFNDYSNFIDVAARWWSARGIAVYAYDQRGFGGAPDHGRWPGKEAFALDLQAMVQLLHQHYPHTPLYLLGESMGAAVVLETLATKSVEVNGVILSAPAVWGWSSMPLWQQWGLRMAACVMPGARFTGESLGVMASDNIEMLRALGRDPLVIKATRVDTIYGLVELMQAGAQAVSAIRGPALVLYGEKDQVIPASAVAAAFAPVAGEQGLQLLQYRNGYHMLLRDRQAEVVWQDVLAWLQRAPLPSRNAGLSHDMRLPGSLVSGGR
ncbi:lysophospholipase [Mariprofundus erugo]|uniref:alpha/beta hydrolase n=1 Tax=Mariprofundus erugo TaxID=2528639 RepID=UPI0010FF07CD|nr:alpha/beta hydrolase [Mariprofundus erugo]TLS77627.1 lysophospholipase [Mariprofundus erugo]